MGDRLCHITDTSKCGEHLKHRETYRDAVLRGLQEELSICSVNSLLLIRPAEKFCTDDEENGIHDHEWAELYLATYDGPFQGGREILNALSRSHSGRDQSGPR